MATVPALVLDALWSELEALVPKPGDAHPLGCHNPRADDRLVFRALILRLNTGCSYDAAAASVALDGRTIRRRRDEWMAAGVFETMWAAVLRAYDKIVGLVLTDLSVDGCITKAPSGGAVSGRSPVDRGKRGTKHSICVDARGVPLAAVQAPANRNDHLLLGSTLQEAATVLDAIDVDLPETASVHLDRGYDNRAVRELLADAGFDPRIATKKTGSGMKSRQRWVVERTLGWLNAFGQIRRCTDRNVGPRRICLLLAMAIVVVRRLVARTGRYAVV